jgi:phage-related protein
LTILWGYPHITVREDQAARAEALHFYRLEFERPEALPRQGEESCRLRLECGAGGRRTDNGEALRGFGGRTVLELVEDFDSDTYRAVYTVRFAGVVYVLHAFQKKAKKGIATPQQDIELIKSRLRDAELHYRARIEKGEGK